MKRETKAWRSAGLFELGAGSVVVGRLKADGHVEAGFFLVDAWCLGVKDAGFDRFASVREFEERLLEELFRYDKPMAISAESARKLLEEAVAFAGRLGFAPCRDYKKGCRVFGGISTAACDEEFVFGVDGRPRFIQGPFESPAQCDRIRRTLEARCGKDGYDYLIACPDPFNDFEHDAAVDSRFVDTTFDELPTPDLQSLAAKIQAEKPDSTVIFNPSGMKVSEMILEVAQPLVDLSPDHAATREIIHLAVIAWNFTVMPPAGQQKILDLITGGTTGRELLAPFVFLAARTLQLFPGNRPAILDIELDENPAGGTNLRVVSTPSRNPPANRSRRQKVAVGRHG